MKLWHHFWMRWHEAWMGWHQARLDYAEAKLGHHADRHDHHLLALLIDDADESGLAADDALAREIEAEIAKSRMPF